MYRKVTRNDCLSVATKVDLTRLDNISDLALLKRLAIAYCALNNLHLGGYLGNWCWDSW